MKIISWTAFSNGHVWYVSLEINSLDFKLNRYTHCRMLVIVYENDNSEKYFNIQHQLLGHVDATKSIFIFIYQINQYSWLTLQNYRLRSMYHANASRKTTFCPKQIGTVLTAWEQPFWIAVRAVRICFVQKTFLGKCLHGTWFQVDNFVMLVMIMDLSGALCVSHLNVLNVLNVSNNVCLICMKARFDIIIAGIATLIQLNGIHLWIKYCKRSFWWWCILMVLL